MRRPITILVGVLATAVAAAAVTAPAWTRLLQETPFPSPKVSVFVSVQTVTSPESGYLTNFFPQGETVVFRMFAGDNKTKRVLTDKDVKYASIKIPGQPNVKLTFSARDLRWPWIGAWTIPADFQPGLVQFQALVKTRDKRYGSFVQIPVVSSQLTVTKA